MNDAGGAEVVKDFHRFSRLGERIVREADVQRFTLADKMIERAHRFRQRCLRVRAVMIKNIDILQPHAPQALVQTGHQVFA